MIKLPKIICFPVTKWHLYGMLAYLLEIYDEEKFQNLKIEVYAVRHSDGSFQLSNKDMPYDNIFFHKEIELKISNSCLLKTPFLIAPKSEKVDEIIIMFANNLLVRKMLSILTIRDLIKKSLQVILVDDGIGSYLSKRVWEKCAKTESNNWIKGYLKLVTSNILKKHLNVTDWHLLTLKDGVLKLNHFKGYSIAIKYDVRKNFSTQIEEFRKKYGDKKKALLLTQPWSETGQIELETERNIVQSIIDSLHDYQVFIKKHPRECENKYMFNNVVVLSKEYPAEFYFCALQEGDCVIGFNSTALLNSALIFGIKTFTIANIVATGKKNNMMDIACSEFLKLTEKIIDVFNNYS